MVKHLIISYYYVIEYNTYNNIEQTNLKLLVPQPKLNYIMYPITSYT